MSADIEETWVNIHANLGEPAPPMSLGARLVMEACEDFNDQLLWIAFAFENREWDKLMSRLSLMVDELDGIEAARMTQNAMESAAGKNIPNGPVKLAFAEWIASKERTGGVQ